MSPIKFEENIKTELEKRTIPVTEGAWEKLQELLGPEPKRKPKKYIWVLGVAASLAVVFWLSKEVFIQSEVSPTIVEQPKEEIVPVQKEDKQLVPEKSEVLVAKGIEQPKTKPENKQVEKNTEESVVKQPSLNSNEVLVASSEQEVTPTESEKMTFEDQKVQEVVAQVVELKEKNNSVSDDEIEALLHNAQKEIEVRKLLLENNTTRTAGTVNPDILLYEVEMELDKSFRTKVFEELKIQFNSVKHAVAQRNN
ncbi:hypothetical protein [Urechidicola vernalis]|uniref:Anti-sigma factor n=1 Tax=Urechidicola vernalis TaxID=3075600 RepID=A0ABU2Y7V6_9FLAO|nr:hypothetical protein [Urechidicola sp. P050]MDT0554112.1 hypothetical protein [Urechidicola sp. P050]